MRYAVISGVQGNVVALNAVLEEIGRQTGIERILCAGDVVGLGPHPNEVIDLLRDLHVDVVKGNYDDAVAFNRISSGVDFPDGNAERVDNLAVAWTRRSLTSERMAYLRELPFDVRVFETGRQIEVKRNEQQELKDFRRSFVTRAMVGSLAERRTRIKPRRILMVHGSPRALNELIRPETANSILASIAERANADIVISGHADVSFSREHAGMVFVGVAGISGPRTRPGEAGFMVLETGREVDAEWVPVTYDPADHLSAISDGGLPSALAARFDLTSL